MHVRLSLAVLVGFLFSSTLALAAPELMVDQPHHNFGTIIQGAKVEHVFSLRNVGDAPLQIRHVKPSCGCTAATVSSTTIMPGKKGEIKASFDSKNFYGSVSKGIVVESNDTKSPAYSLSLSGTIIEEVEVNPKQLNLGRMKAGTAKEMTFTVDNKGKKAVRIVGVKTSSPQATVKVAKYTINPGESSAVMVTVTPRESDRVISGYVGLTTDYPGKQLISVPFFGSPAK